MQGFPSVVVVLGTGGTVAGRLDPDSDISGAYRAGQLPLQLLIEDLKQRYQHMQLPPLEVEQVSQIDSKDLDLKDWHALMPRVEHHLRRKEVCGIVIAHGTDTLEETAIVLGHLVTSDKPVILVGAMRPADAADADGPVNLLNAIGVAHDTQACGVLVVMAGEIHAGRLARKCHPTQFAAFGSGDAGPMGRVVQGRPHWLYQAGAHAHSKFGKPLPIELLMRDPWPWVEIITSHSGADGRVIDLLVAQGVKGLVVAGTGNGTVHVVLESALARARQLGVAVRRCTRMTSQSLSPEESKADPEASELTPVQARVQLQLDILVRDQAQRCIS